MNTRHFVKDLDFNKLQKDTPIFDLVKRSSPLGHVMRLLDISTLAEAADTVPGEIWFGLVDERISSRTARNITCELGNALRAARIRPMHRYWACFY